MIEIIAEYINSHIAHYYRSYVNDPLKFVPEGISKNQEISGGAFKVPLKGIEELINVEHLRVLVPHASEIKLTSESIEVYFTWPKKVFEDEVTIADPVKVSEESPDTKR